MEQLIEFYSVDDKSHSAAVDTPDVIYADLPNDEDAPNTSTVRRRNRVPNPITWKRKKNALLRERGQSYYGIKTVVDGEGRKWCTEVPRGGRKMKPRCECKSPAFECKKVGDEVRQRLFDEFWARSWEEKRAYMSRLVVLGDVMRPRNRKDASFSRRSKSLKYYFEADGLRYRVCKTMFLNTFDLSQWSVHGWPKKWSSVAGDHSMSADVDCLLDESVDATDSWFEEFISRLPEEGHSGSRSKKRKTSSPSTDSSKIDGTDEWISESEGEEEQVESTTISFVDVSAMNGDSDDEHVDSVLENTKYRECETSTPSVDLTSQQSDLHQMLLDMSRRMEEMQEKFDNRLQSVESQLSEISQNKNREIPTADTKFPVSFARSVSSDEQEADSLTESQIDAQSLDNTPNPKAKIILPHITSHVQNCYLNSCETCRKLRRISEKIETKPLSDVKSLHYIVRRPINRRSRARGPVSKSPTNDSVQCAYCLRYYDDSSQLSFHINRHSMDDTRSCCHCCFEADERAFLNNSKELLKISSTED